MAPPSTGPVRTLLLLRHAKAEASNEMPDLGRALSRRGTADAAAVGAWLAETQLSIDLVVCSASLRTRQTWEIAVSGGAQARAVVVETRVYEASAHELLEVLRETPDEVHVLLLVGHAPGVPQLVSELADPGTSDSEALVDVHERYPTNGLCQLEYAGDWADLDAGGASLVAFTVPRG